MLSCQKENTIEVAPDLTGMASDPVYDYILKLGFDRSKIVDLGDCYVVEGDIRFNKLPKAPKGARPAHLIFNERPLVKHDDVDKISVRVSDTFGNDDEWRQRVITATANAIATWNNISGCKVKFTYTAGPTARITVQYRPNLTGSGFSAISQFPISCNSGTTIDLNRTTSRLLPGQLLFLMTHELGHSLGLRHTDDASTLGFLIPYTPNTETASIMNSGSSFENAVVPAWSNFSSGDLLASLVLYPNVATASPYINDSNKVVVDWTPSYFCNTRVRVDVSENGTLISGVEVDNNGQYTLDFRTTVPDRYYRCRVYALDDPDPNRYLQGEVYSPQ
jgi:hypothetical protein